MGKYLKIKKNVKSSSIQAIKVDFDFSREKKQFFIADSKLKVDQIKRKTEAKFNIPIFI